MGSKAGGNFFRFWKFFAFSVWLSVRAKKSDRKLNKVKFQGFLTSFGTASELAAFG